MFLASGNDTDLVTAPETTVKPVEQPVAEVEVKTEVVHESSTVADTYPVNGNGSSGSIWFWGAVVLCVVALIYVVRKNTKK